MPYHYAHYRFGVAMLNAMPADLQRAAKRHRRLFDVGLHGPDIFFCYNLLRHTKIGSLGSRIHSQTGKEFFARVCRNLRLRPSPEGEAYLYGLLCHYALDSACHPFIWEQDKQGIAEHIAMETEFDRFLLDMDGKRPPENQKLTKHLYLEPGECATAARFYPEATDKAISRSLRNMVLINRVLAMKNETARELMKKSIGLAGWEYRGFVMTKGPDPRCSWLDGPIFERYKKAEEKFPSLLLQLSAHLTYNAPLERDFSATFG